MRAHTTVSGEWALFLSQHPTNPRHYVPGGDEARAQNGHLALGEPIVKPAGTRLLFLEVIPGPAHRTSVGFLRIGLAGYSSSGAQG